MPSALPPEKWDVIKSLYAAASSLRTPDLRARLLADCADPEIRREVEALLAADQQATDWFATGLHQPGPALEPVTLSAGDHLGRYLILQKLGRGGMGQVYLAEDARLGRKVAIKTLTGRLMHDADAADRLEKEAQAVSALNHPHILTVFEIAEHESTRFMVAEYINGVTLRAKLAGGPLPLAEVRQLALQVTGALDLAHRSGIIHRDLKPENLMIRPDGLVKVLDFGLARYAGPVSLAAGVGSVASGYTQHLAGTPSYMSPEQTRMEPVDGRTDIYSLGLVLYEMLTGRPAFSAPDLDTLLEAQRAQMPAPLKGPLRNVLWKAIAKDPNQRYATMAEFGEAIDRATRPRRWWMAAAALLAVAATAGIIATRPDAHRVPIGEVIPLTSFNGEKDSPAFSPDGKRFAFSWRGPVNAHRADLFVKPVGDGDPVRLTETPLESEYSPAWSPDGRWLAYSAATKDRGVRLRVMPAAGGEYRELGDLFATPGWSPDSRQIIAATWTDPKSAGVALYDLATGNRRLLTNPKGMLDGYARFSPDGRRIAFVRYFSPSNREVMVMDADGKRPPEQWTNDSRVIAGLTWMRDGSGVIMTSNRRAGQKLWLVRGPGAEPLKVETGETAFTPEMSLDGRRLAYVLQYSDSNLYRKEPGKPAVPIAESTREDNSPALSPDGKRLVYISKRTGTEELYVCNADGSGTRALTSLGAPATGSPQWSPDGKTIVFDTRHVTSPDLFLVDVDGGAPPRRLTDHPMAEITPRWSPDGKTIYFGSNRTGRNEVFAMPATGGPARQITTGGFSNMLLSPDSKRLYITKGFFAPGLWELPAEGGPEKPVPGFEKIVLVRQWGFVGDDMYFCDRPSNPAGAVNSVTLYSPATGKFRPFATFEGVYANDIPSLAIAPNGEMFYSLVVRKVNDIMMLDNLR